MSRSKDQWFEETGGLRVGETDGQFQARVAEIQRLKQSMFDPSLREGMTLEQVQRRICALKGIYFDGYDNPDDES